MDPSQLQLMGVAVQPGAVLLGKYRVDRVIGVGGMGAVIGARHLQLDERVAIKFLLPEMLANEEVVQRFLREARAAIKIRSEHCVRVLDVGTLENGAPYMVMEFLEGQDLAAIVEHNRRLAIADVVDWVLQAGEALAEAHALGIVHRDLKPANLFLTRRADGSPSVKVLDFGISKQAASGADAGVTKTQAVLGSPRYMSPEQMRSTKDVDARADVWALGAVVHELISGDPPFDAETMTALCAAILQDAPRPMRVSRPDVPAELEAIVRGALEKDRDRRYANMAQFAAALAPFGSAGARVSAERIARILGIHPAGLGRGPQASQPMLDAGSPASALAATTGSAVAAATTHAKSSTAAIVAAGGVAAVLVVGGAITLMTLRRPHPSEGSVSSASNAPSASAALSSAAASPLAGPALANPQGAPSLASAGATAPTLPSPPASLPPLAPALDPAPSALLPPSTATAPHAPLRPSSGGGGRTPVSPSHSAPPAPKAPPPSNGNNPFGDDRKG